MSTHNSQFPQPMSFQILYPNGGADDFTETEILGFGGMAELDQLLIYVAESYQGHIHIESRHQSHTVFLWIDGELRPIRILTAEQERALVAAVFETASQASGKPFKDVRAGECDHQVTLSNGLNVCFVFNVIPIWPVGFDLIIRVFKNSHPTGAPNQCTASSLSLDARFLQDK